MKKRIVYKREDGGVSIIIPSPNSGLTVEQVAAKDVPKGRPYKIVDESVIPKDRSFRGAWNLDLGEGVVSVNMQQAKDILRDKIREARVEPLGMLDTAFLKALELGSDTSQITSDKQALRDATADPTIDAATTPEDLMRVNPAGIFKPNHKK